MPPCQIVPALADEGTYIASESTFYRVLREEKMQNHRGRSQEPGKHGKPTSYCATAPNQVWTWDITYLSGPVKGIFFYLYLIIDIFSRDIVGWEVCLLQNINAESCRVKMALPHLLVKQLSIVHEFGFQQEFTASPVHRLLNCFYLAVISLNKGIT